MSSALRQPPRRHSQLRLVLFQTVEVFARALGGRRFYRWLNLRAGRFDVREEIVIVPQECADLAGLSIVQLSDIHAGPFLREGDLRDVVRAVQDLDPDVVVFTGDLISRNADEAQLVLKDLASIKPRHGFYGVFGNHDYRHRREGEILETYASAGIHFLRNACVRPLGADSSLILLGVEDLEEAQDLDISAARSEVRPGDFEVVLSHNPGGARALLSDATRLVLSGHTHGKQIDLPVLRTLGPHHPGDRVDVPGAVLVTSRGLGVIGVPLRIRVRPEIVVIRLRAESAGVKP